MKNNFYLKRLGALTFKGIQIGIVLSFISSLVYDILFMAIMAITFFVMTVRQGYHIYNDDVAGLLILSTILCFGFIPTILLGALDGMLIGITLAFWKTRLPNILASFIGLIVGTVLISIINNLTLLHNLIPFSLDTSSWFFSTLFLSQDLSYSFPGGITVPMNLLPKFIAILISAYAGWRINKSKVLETNS